MTRRDPTAEWTAQQVVDAFPDDTAPRWIHRDCDRIYPTGVIDAHCNDTQRLPRLGVHVLQHKLVTRSTSALLLSFDAPVHVEHQDLRKHGLRAGTWKCDKPTLIESAEMPAQVGVAV